MTTNVESISTGIANAMAALASAARHALPKLFPEPQPIDVMIDLETTGTGPSAAIAAIGAVTFDRIACTLDNTFYSKIDISTSAANGGAIDADTFKWWLAQSDEPRRSFDGKEHINQALIDFTAWLGAVTHDIDLVRIWGNGTDFDVVILAESFKRAVLPVPWKFWNTRCFRTLKSEYPHVRMDRHGTHHNALDDAISQAEHVLKIDQARRAAAKGAV